MSDRLRIGVIGVGTFGSLHAQVYRQLGTCELVAVADVNQARLQEMSTTLGVDGYVDYRDLLQREDIDAVSICTTDEFHVEPAVAAAGAGKHILIEKPLALTPADCDTIIGAARAAGIKLMVGHILRFDPRYHAAHQEIQSGRIGQLVHLTTRRNNSLRSAQRLAMHTSVLFFLGIHDLDFVLWCAGSKPQSVYARSVTKMLEGTPDTVFALLSFAGGTVGSLEASWVLPESHPRGLDARFDAVGTTGAVYVNGTGDSVSIVNERLEHPGLWYAPELYGVRGGILRDEIDHFCQCVLFDREPAVTGQDGKHAVQVACAIQASYETGTVVEVEP
jgi:UDP-N-acetylglucosamine 3-dehydrogenase